ncbi:sensor histidine kinase [Parapusillimonas granuli]|uniref:histidine kinase n=1 Tax=Parapusillimonas granuli TaxID=380911 RepID=A0A853G0S8_9BURK|nr:HAMP domain-containing sensor histidine kinase [Parapusillimonas granuli]MBB5215415.1 signal transduction histidine kinase [Parapusillimonas granuli]MEB2400253.1 HAMP domain-containing sensor histidine kinase [Alcaligenaceae bacterium]NYT49917.1 HAMP domain-containing histidine kinase [Parapusillimonas granuli]
MKHRLRNALHAVWNSVAFRLTLNYSLFALSTSLILLSIVYYQTTGIQASQFSRQVAITAQRLGAHYNQGGLQGLVREIELELADQVNTDTEMFLLLDPAGRALAGNIEPAPALDALGPEGTDLTVLLRGRPAHGYVVAHALPDGSRLIVGHDLRDLHEITQLIKHASLAAVGVTAVLVLLGALLFRRAMQRRVEVIRRTAAKVGAGQITQRVPMERKPDEFALLTHDINNMLDRIELLMLGVRNVSDAVAHQLRTPLTRMLARLRTIDLAQAERRELEASIACLVTEIEDLAKVSEKLLQISELESGAMRKRFEPSRLDVIASDVVELYEALAEEKKARLVVASAAPVTVHGDPDLLAGAIACMVDNALKYAGSPARIKVSIERQGDETVLTVADNGPGISPDKHARIGERFYRLRPDVPGYGLGLTTVMAIARLHGARFELANGNPGLRVSLRFGPADAQG